MIKFKDIYVLLVVWIDWYYNILINLIINNFLWYFIKYYNCNFIFCMLVLFNVFIILLENIVNMLKNSYLFDVNII